MSTASGFNLWVSEIGADLHDDPPGWREQASCRRTDTSLFFPPGSTGVAIEVILAAKAVCRSCPVQDPCLRFALATNQIDGIWGGKDEAERRKLRRLRRQRRRLPDSVSV